MIDSVIDTLDPSPTPAEMTEFSGTMQYSFEDISQSLEDEEWIGAGQGDERAPSFSQESTIYYAYCGHVPYNVFEPQVRELCRVLWHTSEGDTPEKPLVKRIEQRSADSLEVKEISSQPTYTKTPKELIIEHLRGGSFNRVIGITTVDEDETESRMILRIPRENLAEPKQDVTILQFVQENVVVPISQVVAYDFTTDNPLNAPYVLQKRIPRFDLESKARPHPALTHEQKKTFVEEFSQILVNLRHAEHPYAGKIGTRVDENGEKTFTVSPFSYGQEFNELIAKRSAEMPFFKTRTFGTQEGGSDSLDELEERTTFFFLMTQFGLMKQCQLELRPDLVRTEGFLDRLVKVAVQMRELGYLDALSEDDHGFCLTHYDLYPRNIMVDVREDGTLDMTGILDWDLAMFAPKWVHCRPPMWIWNWLDGGSEDESKAWEMPSTKEQQELKELFEEIIGSDFHECSYHPGYRMARRLFHYAQLYVFDEEAYDSAERFVEEWSEYYAEHKPGDDEQHEWRQDGDSADDTGNVASEKHEDAQVVDIVEVAYETVNCQ